ncbi:MAG: S1 RNA-binding domain-containing protein [bacterium]|nr:S1 RNA-binding domain-containing protein [bacterium]
MGKKNDKQQDNPEHPEENSEMEGESFEDLMAESFQPVKSISLGDEVEAVVIGFDNDHIFLDLGTRLDGVVKKAEYMISGELSIGEGDTIKVFVNGKRGGVWLCSGRLGSGESEGRGTRQTAALIALEEAFNSNKPVEGHVVASIKGGFEVELMGVKAFCPISQIDRTYCDSPDDYVNQIYPFVIIRFEEDGDNVVVSRRELLNLEAAKEAEKMWRTLDENEIYEGTVTAVRDFGAFVDIGGIEGLLHISEISYRRLENVSDELEVGQKVKVAVKGIDRQMRKVSFSRKALLDDPWTEATKKLSTGGEFQGKVVRMKTFGAFVELFPGVDGMVHISRLGTDRRHQHPKEVLKIGDIVTVRILEIDKNNRRISLTMEKKESDYSNDLDKLKKDQASSSKSNPSHMASLVDAALKNDKS